MDFVVYALESLATGRTYVGQTAALDARLAQHNTGAVISTRNDRPWKVIALERFSTRAKARWCEYTLKRSHGTRTRWLRTNAIQHH